MKGKDLVCRVVGTIGFVSILGVGQGVYNLYKVTSEDYKNSKMIGYDSKGNPCNNCPGSILSPQTESEAWKGTAMSLTTFLFCLGYLNKKENT